MAEISEDPEKERVLAEIRKLHAEARKLEAEARDLNRKPWERPSAWLALGSALVALVAGLITLPSGYITRIRTISDQQERISKQANELAELRAQRDHETIAENQRTLASLHDQIQHEQGQIKQEHEKSREIAFARKQAEASLKIGRQALQSVQLERDRLERSNMGLNAAEEARSSMLSEQPDYNRSLMLAVLAVTMSRAQGSNPPAPTVNILRQALFLASRIPISLSNSLEDIDPPVAWSPLRSKIAVTREEGVEVLDTTSWRRISSFKVHNPKSLWWNDEDHLLVVESGSLFRAGVANENLEWARCLPEEELIGVSRDLKSFLILRKKEPGGSGTVSSELVKCNLGAVRFVPWSNDPGGPAAEELQGDQCRTLFSLKPGESVTPASDSTFSRFVFSIENELFSLDSTQTSPKHVPLEHASNITDTLIRWSPSDRFLAIIRTNYFESLKSESLERLALHPLPSYATSVAWTPDDEYALITSPRLLTFWNSRSPRELVSFQVAEHFPASASVSPDRSKVLVQGLGSEAGVYSLDPVLNNNIDVLIARAQNQIKGTLPAEDCHRIFGSTTCPPIR